MDENENKKLPKFGSIDELTNFFDENDLGEYLESMPEVDFEVELGSRKHYVAVDDDVAERLSEISKNRTRAVWSHRQFLAAGKAFELS